jgi:hypothetical protein
VNVDHVRVPSDCIGCVTAADVDMVEHGAYVVHVHPDCPVHSELVQLRAEVRQLREELQTWESVSLEMRGEDEVQAWYMRRLYGRVQGRLGGREVGS